MTNEELQAMLAAAYGGQMRPADMGLNAEPRSEWESYKYNMANPGRTAAEPDQKMALSDYPKVWYDRIIGQPLQGMTGAGDALLGRTNPDLETFNKDVLDALSLYAGPTIAKGMLGGVPRATELSIFGGVGAKEAPLRMRDIAEKALAAGKDPDEVWKVTGWKPGMEGKMRFEIDDRVMGLKLLDSDKIGVKRLEDIVSHDALIKQYPELKDVHISYDLSSNINNGKFSVMSNDMPEVGIKAGDSVIHVNARNADEAKYTLTHEIQHWVQQKEGFARGGSPEMFMREGLDSIPSALEVRAVSQGKELLDFLEKYPDVTLKELLDKPPVYLRDAAETAKRFPVLQDWMSDPKYFKQKLIDITPPEENYLNLAGEIESRDAAARRTWDTDMRRAVPPDMRKDAIIRMGGGGTAAQVDNMKDLKKMSSKELSETLGAGRIYFDNPGGEWLAHERRRAMINNGGGSVTASIRKIELPIDVLEKLEGRLGEHKRILEGDERVLALSEKIKKEGFTSEPFLNVEWDGSVNINEGNHRIRAAKLAGLKSIPVEIRYYAGGELSDGPMSFDNLLKYKNIGSRVDIKTGNPDIDDFNSFVLKQINY